MTKSIIPKVVFSWDKGVVLFLVLSIFIGSYASEYFATASNLSFVIASIAEIAIIAIAMAYLIISGEIDLSVASIMALTSASIGYAFQEGVPFEIAVVLGLLVGLLAGLFNGVLVTIFGLPSLAVTIATLALFRGLIAASAFCLGLFCGATFIIGCRGHRSVLLCASTGWREQGYDKRSLGLDLVRT